jgi:hypothetical protein
MGTFGEAPSGWVQSNGHEGSRSPHPPVRSRNARHREFQREMAVRTL